MNELIFKRIASLHKGSVDFSEWTHEWKCSRTGSTNLKRHTMRIKHMCVENPQILESSFYWNQGTNRCTNYKYNNAQNAKCQVKCQSIKGEKEFVGWNPTPQKNWPVRASFRTCKSTIAAITAFILTAGFKTTAKILLQAVVKIYGAIYWFLIVICKSIILAQNHSYILLRYSSGRVCRLGESGPGNARCQSSSAGAPAVSIVPNTLVNGAQPAYWTVTVRDLAAIVPGHYNSIYWSSSKPLFANPDYPPDVDIDEGIFGLEACGDLVVLS